MDAFDLLHHELRSARPELPVLEDLIHEDRCLEIQLGPVRFLVSLLREWRAGLVVHAQLGQTPTQAQDQLELLREALTLNSGHATRHEPIYALQQHTLMCRYRLPLGEANAAGLLQHMQRVVDQQQAWVQAGWLSPLSEEGCA